MGRSPARSGTRTSPLHACTRYTRQRIQRPDSPATSTRRAARLNRYAVQADAGSWHRPFPRSDRRATAAASRTRHPVAAIHGRRRSPRGPTRCACCSPNITPDYANRRSVTARAQGPRAKEPMRSKRRASPSLRIICVHVGWPAGAVAPGPRGPNFFASPAHTSLCALPSPTCIGCAWTACIASDRLWPRACTRAAHAYACTCALRAHEAARLNRCAVQADAASGGSSARCCRRKVAPCSARQGHALAGALRAALTRLRAALRGGRQQRSPRLLGSSEKRHAHHVAITA